jgi:hypothetical protein
MILAAHECVYGVLTDGGEITETLITENIDCPTYRVNGRYCIGLLQDYLDRRKGLATHYNYCPYCGKKLDHRKIKQIAKDCDQRMGDGYDDTENAHTEKDKISESGKEVGN